MDCWKWSTVFRKNLEWKQWPEENVEKLVWNNEEISWSSGGRSGREHTNCEGLWCKRSRLLQPCPTLCDPMDPMDSPGMNTGVGSHFLLQGIFLTQGSNLGLPHCRQSLDYLLSHQGLQYWSAEWWGDEDARIAGGEGWKDAGQFIHSPQPLCYTSSLPPFLPSLSSFIWLWESFLSSVEVLAFVAGSFLSGKFL